MYPHLVQSNNIMEAIREDRRRQMELAKFAHMTGQGGYPAPQPPANQAHAHFSGYPDASPNPLLQRANMSGTHAHMAGGARPAVKGLEAATARIYVKVISTDDSSTLELNLFGKNRGLTDPAGLTVQVGKDTHEAFKNRTVHKPFIIEGFRGIYQTTDQLQEEVELISDDNNSSIVQNFYPAASVNASQNQKLIVDDADFHFLVTGDSRLKMDILPAPAAGQTNILTMVFNVRAVSDLAALLQGDSVLGYNSKNLGGANIF